MKTSTSIAMSRNVSQHRLWGGLSILGAISYGVLAIALVQYGEAYPPALELLGMLWALGCICGLIGIATLGAAGQNVLGRVAVGLAMLFYAIAAVDALLLALGGSRPFESPLFAISRLGTLPATLLVGVATLLARRWAGWRKFAPFAIPLAMPIALLVGALTGAQLPIPIFIALAWFIIGYAVWSTPEP